MKIKTMISQETKLMIFELFAAGTQDKTGRTSFPDLGDPLTPTPHGRNRSGLAGSKVVMEHSGHRHCSRSEGSPPYEIHRRRSDAEGSALLWGQSASPHWTSRLFLRSSSTGPLAFASSLQIEKRVSYWHVFGRER